jgi:hypothetical protein
MLNSANKPQKEEDQENTTILSSLLYGFIKLLTGILTEKPLRKLNTKAFMFHPSMTTITELNS